MSEKVHILEANIHGFQRISVAEVLLDDKGQLIRVVGQNRQGKTSFLNGIKSTLGGAGIVPEAAINQAGSKAEAVIRLSEGTEITRRFSEKAPKGRLMVKTEDGRDLNQTELNEFMGEISFDPMTFLSLMGKDQAGILLGLSDTHGLEEQLEEIAELRKSTYEERTPYLSRIQQLRKVERPAGERPERVSTAELIAQLEEAQTEQTGREVAQQNLNRLRGGKLELESEIAALEQRVIDAKADLLGAEQSIERLEKKVEELPDRSEKVDRIKGFLVDAEGRNDAQKPWDLYEESVRQLKEDEAAATVLTNRMDLLEEQKQDLLQTADFPIPNLSFDDDSNPLYNDLPLSSASGRERVELAVRVALGYNPSVAVCFIDEEANSLDDEGLRRLHELAVLHNFQVFACRIVPGGPGAEIVIDDGEVVANAKTED